MLKNVHFVSQRQAEAIDGQSSVIVISIHDSSRRPALRSGFRDVLFLCFDDYDQNRDGIDALMEPFSLAQAETLKAWLGKYLDDDTVSDLLVHCHAGISRSAAVAWWAHKKHGLELKTEYPAWHLNRHVLRTLDSAIEPPPLPDNVPAMPYERSTAEVLLLPK